MLDPQISEEIERMSDEVRRYKVGQTDEEAWRRFRLQNGIYGVRFQTGIQMVRVKVPCGELSADQLRALGKLVEIFGGGIAHVTTRQDLQIYWVALEAVPEFLRRLGDVGLTTREASGNTVRNVTACHLAGICPKEPFDVTPYARRVSRYLLRNPISQNMPRKFKIAFSGCGDDCAVVGVNDVGAVAAVKEVDGQGVRGFRIWVGGGLGSPPRAAQLLEDFTSAEDLLITVEAAIRVFDRLGNRDDVFRARMKFVIDRIGIGEFRRLVLKERWAIRATKAGDPEMRVESEIVKRKLPGVVETVDDGGVYARWFETNVLSQKQEGYYAVTVTLPGGDVTARQFGALAEIAERYGDGTVRTTIRQNLVLRWIEGGDVERVYRDLERVDMVWPGADTVCDVVGCAGADTCNLGITRSHRLAMKLSESLSAAEGLMLDEDLEGVSIKVSGCPNACGQHHVATIGLFGAAQRVDGRMVPYYQLLMGGRAYDGEVRFGETVTKVPAKRVPDAISKILVLYREKRQAGETFLSWVDRTLSEQGE